MNFKISHVIVFFISLALSLLGVFFFNDVYSYIIFAIIGLAFFLLMTSKIGVFFEKIDIFSPKVIFPVLFLLVSLLGSLGDKEISVLYIAKIEEFKWQYYALALLSFFAGIFVITKKKIVVRQKVWNPRTVITPAITLFFIAVISTFIFFKFKGGIPLFSKDINATRFVSTHGIINILPYFMRLLIVVAIVSFLSIFTLKKNEKNKKRIFGLLAILSAVVLSLGGGRQFVQIFFLGMVAYHYQHTRLNIKKILPYFLAIIILFSIFGYIRTKSTIGKEIIEEQLARIEYPDYLPSWTAPPYVYSRIVAEVFHLILKTVPKEMEYQRGKFTFGDFLVFLPGKHKKPDFIFTDDILESDSSSSGGTALSFMTNFYMDFGLTGIVVGFFIIGLLLQVTYQQLIFSKNTKYTAIYSLLLYYSVLGIYGNALFSPIAIWEFSSILILDIIVIKIRPSSMERDIAANNIQTANG